MVLHKNISLSARNIFLHSILSLFSAPGQQTPPPKNANPPISIYSGALSTLFGTSPLLCLSEIFHTMQQTRGRHHTPSFVRRIRKLQGIKKEIHQTDCNTYYLSFHFLSKGRRKPPIVTSFHTHITFFAEEPCGSVRTAFLLIPKKQKP